MSRKIYSFVLMAGFAASLVVGLWLMLGLLKSSRQTASIGGPFQLKDQFGKTVTETGLLGRPTLMFFGFTHCPDICPTSLFEMSEVLRAMGNDADRVNAFFVSVDPERDTAESIKDYLASFDPHLRGLTGTSEELAKITAEYRVYSKKVPLKGGDYTIDHTSLVYLMNSEGKFAKSFDIKRTPQQAAAELERYF
jgi:protein SCO1/2